MTLETQLIRLAHSNPELREVVVPLIRKHAITFTSDGALRKYLRDHPDADRSRHHVEQKERPSKAPEDEEPGGAEESKKPKEKSEPKEKSDGEDEGTETSKGGLGKRLKDLFSRAKPKKEIEKALADAPEEVHDLVVDEGNRTTFLKKVAATVKKTRATVVSKIVESAKSEVHELKHAVHAAKKLVKRPPGPFSKADKAAFYAAGAYVASSVVAAVPPGGALMATGMFGKSFALHVAIKAVSKMLDKGFLHFEWAETLLHAIKLGSEKGEGDDKATKEFITALTHLIEDELSKGVSEKEMEKILKGVEMPSGESEGKEASVRIRLSPHEVLLLDWNDRYHQEIRDEDDRDLALRQIARTRPPIEKEYARNIVTLKRMKSNGSTREDEDFDELYRVTQSIQSSLRILQRLETRLQRF